MSRAFFSSFDDFVNVARRDKVLYMPKRAKNKNVILEQEPKKEIDYSNFKVSDSDLKRIERILK